MPDSIAACVLDSEDSCLPITALRCVRLDGRLLVLAGQGPHVNVYNETGQWIFSSRVFEVQPIHGIQVAPDAVSQRGRHGANVVIWGGSLVKSGILAITDEHDPKCVPEVALSLANEVSAKDWVLDVALLQSSMVVLTAHNALLEVSTSRSNQMSLCHELVDTVQGPGAFLYSGQLCAASSDHIIVASGTVFGEILVWTCSKGSEDSEWSPSLRHVFHGHNGSIFGVAMSERLDMDGRKARLLASCSDDRTIRLWDISDCDDPAQSPFSGMACTETGFGTAVQVGEPQLASAWGHQSRIWGVHFAPERATGAQPRVLLSSWGEDAALQLWEYEAGTAAEGFGHLKPVYHDRYHNGKNIWSMSQLGDEESLVVCTGGADGQIFWRSLKTNSDCLTSSLTVSKPFKELTRSPQALKNYLILSPHECLATSELGEVFRLRMNKGQLDASLIHKSPTKGNFLLCRAEMQGIIFLAQQTGGLSAFVGGMESPISIPIPDKSGISWMQVASQTSPGSSSSKICLVAVLADRRAIVLWLTFDGSAFQVQETTILLPNTFIITACHYDTAEEILFLGSRAGALAVYCLVTPEVEISTEPFCLRHLHGTDSVTSIGLLAKGPRTQVHLQDRIHFLTTGRDGTFGIHRLTWPQSDRSLQPQFRTVHMSSPPFGPIVEGAYLTSPETSVSSQSPDLVLYGFRSTSFIVWNETQQSLVLSIECGGAHRSWSYKDESALPDNKTIDSARSKGRPKTFIWTKAGRSYWHSADRPSHTVIQKGGHGREIKAVAQCSRNLYSGTLIATGAEDTTIQLFRIPSLENPRSHNELATPAAESHGVCSTFQRITTMKRHTTGLQHLVFSSSGEFLFSSAGFEEFYAWKLTPDVPHVSIGVVLWDIMPKKGEDSDARIMSFDVLEGLPTHDNSDADIATKYFKDSYILALAYSNGKTKILRYTPSTAKDQGSFETLREIVYGSFCVMQAFFLQSTIFSDQLGFQNSQSDILSAGTNGFLNLNLNLNLFSDGLKTDTDKTMSPAMQVHRAHQSSILAMDIMRLSPQTYLVATGGDDNGLGLTLVSMPSTRTSSDTASSSPSPSLSPISGQAESETPILEGPLASSTSRQQHKHTDIPSTRRFRTVLIPRAHAAALTALKVKCLRRASSRLSLAIVTAGNDQRVKVWIVHVDLDSDRGMEFQDPMRGNMQVQRATSSWTAVADVSGLEVIDEECWELDLPTSTNAGGSSTVTAPASETEPEPEPKSALITADRKGQGQGQGQGQGHVYAFKILVVGVGMELLSVKWKADSEKE